MPSLARVRTIRWLVLIDMARVTKSHLDDHLNERDRRHVLALARRTRGDVRKLTEREKADLKRIARELNLTLLARDLLPSAQDVRRRVKPGR